MNSSSTNSNRSNVVGSSRDRLVTGDKVNSINTNNNINIKKITNKKQP